MNRRRFVVNAVWMVAAVLGVARASFADAPFCNRMKPVPQTAKFIDPDFFIWGASGGKSETEVFVKSVLPVLDNFYFYEIDVSAIFPTIPNELVIHTHTDRWLLLPSVYRDNAWKWMNGGVRRAR